MPITSSDLLRVARLLAEGNDEVSWRSAVNRAYYAAYHSLLDICDHLPASCDEQRGRDRVSHAEVIARLRQWRPTGEAVRLQRMASSADTAFRHIRTARTMRERADYRLASSINQDEAKQQLARAGQLCRFVFQVQTELKRAAA
jgi:uncharacterized protein (UPF0332 family)